MEQAANTGTPHPSRRQIVAGGVAGVALAQDASAQRTIRRKDRVVRLELMRPGQLETAGRAFPVAYVPFGTIEWHGRHLPLGCDALKAHGILVRTALEFGGVVFPPVYLHDGFGRDHMVPLVSRLFARLRATGFKVIMGVSGHNVREQIAMIEEALAPVTRDGAVRGVGLWEITLSACRESNTDHAAKWETSDMMHLHPDCVDIGALGAGQLRLDMKPPDGIGGEDPRRTASAKVGRRCIELAAQAIGRKARELLESLPSESREFGLKGVSPEHWWMV